MLAGKAWSCGRLHIRRRARLGFFEQPGDSLVGGICLSIEYQDRYVDPLEGLRRQIIHEGITNDGRHHFRIGSRDPSPPLRFAEARCPGIISPFSSIFAFSSNHT